MTDPFAAVTADLQKAGVAPADLRRHMLTLRAAANVVQAARVAVAAVDLPGAELEPMLEHLGDNIDAFDALAAR